MFNKLTNYESCGGTFTYFVLCSVVCVDVLRMSMRIFKFVG